MIKITNSKVANISFTWFLVYISILCNFAILMPTIIQQLNAYYKYRMFNPGYIGLLFNPFYLVRTRIYKNVKKFAPILEGKMLDFGCGNKPYKGLFNVKSYIGLDMENPGHSHETEPVDVYYDGRNIPFENNTFDSFFSSQVFEHVFDLPFSLKELNRVLRPGGRGLIIVPFVWDEHEVPFDFARYTQFGLKHLLTEAGFEIETHNRDAHFVAVIAQLISYYVYRLTETKFKYLNMLFAFLLIFPINAIGIIFSFFLPKVYSLYFNNVFIVKKPV